MATTEFLSMAQEFYIGYYGRPADPSGLEYWANRFDQSDNLDDALTAFGASAEYTDNFGSLTNSELINNLYQQMFGRDAGTEGLEFYTARLESGEASLASIAAQIIDGATDDNFPDATVLANRVTVAQTYTDEVTSQGTTYDADDIAAAQALLAAVDATDASVTSGNAAAENLVAADAGVTYTLAADLTSVTEGNDVVFTVTANASVDTDTTLSYKVAGAAAGAVEAADPAADLAKVAGEVVIAAGETTGTFTLTPLADNVAEGFEGFNVTLLNDAYATVATSSDIVIKDGADVGRIFSLTDGVDNLIGASGNDTFNAVETVFAGVLGGLDKIDGKEGTDTFNIADTATAAVADFALPAGMTIENIEVLNLTTNGAVGTYSATNDTAAFDISSLTGLTSAAFVAAGKGTASGSEITAADTTDVSLTVAGNNAAEVNGGKAVTIVSGKTGSGVTDVQGKGLTSVSVKGGGVVTIDNLGGVAGITTSVGKTMTAVTLEGIDGATAAVNGAAIEELTVKNQDTALATTITNATSKALSVNVDNAGYDAAGAAVAGVTVAAGAKAEAITVNATGSKSNVTVDGAAAKTLNITGDADLILASTTAFTALEGSAATGDLTLGTLNAATVKASTGAGDDTLGIAATAKVTVATGAGEDSVSLTSAIAAGSTIELGDGSDAVLDGGGGSVATDTATSVTNIDGGEGLDTVSASLINAANADQFVNFEALDLSASVANLDVELMTGSTITALTLTGDGGVATTSRVSNVATDVGLTVSGDNSFGGSTTIGIKGAAAATDNSFDITFDGVGTNKAGTVVVDDVENINIASVVGKNDIVLTDDDLQTITITGDTDLTLAFTGTNGTNAGGAGGGAVNLIDGSAATGKLNINTTNVTADSKADVGLTVKGGSEVDTITLAQAATVEAGAGNDTITSSANGGTFAGGAGDDTFDLSAAITGGITEATSVISAITDVEAGDTITFGAITTFNATKIALDATVQNLDDALALATVAANNAAGDVSWFQYGSSTYLVQDNDGATNGLSAGDVVVKLTGLVDLSDATTSGSDLIFA